ncbi:MAG: PUA domain-containing protein, partial [Halalkalicoccus sp.]
GHMGHLRRTGTTPFDDSSMVSLYDLTDAIAFAEEGGQGCLREVLAPGERALAHLPRVTVAPSAAREIAHGAQVYAPGVIDAEGDPDEEPLVACYTPAGAAVCLGRLVGNPDADSGRVVELERVLV